MRDINNKNKEELSQKLKNQEDALAKLLADHNQLQDTCRSIETKLFQERAQWVEEKERLIKEA